MGFKDGGILPAQFGMDRIAVAFDLDGRLGHSPGQAFQFSVDGTAGDKPAGDSESLAVEHERFANRDARRNGDTLKFEHGAHPARRQLNRFGEIARRGLFPVSGRRTASGRPTMQRSDPRKTRAQRLVAAPSVAFECVWSVRDNQPVQSASRFRGGGRLTCSRCVAPRVMESRFMQPRFSGPKFIEILLKQASDRRNSLPGIRASRLDNQSRSRFCRQREHVEDAFSVDALGFGHQFNPRLPFPRLTRQLIGWTGMQALRHANHDLTRERFLHRRCVSFAAHRRGTQDATPWPSASTNKRWISTGVCAALSSPQNDSSRN